MILNNDTLKSRRFELELSDADIVRFYELAYMTGTTPAEILQGFICDLVGGSQTRGSDERLYAERYLDRCCYDLAPLTFIGWAMKHYNTAEIIACLEVMRDMDNDLEYYAECHDKDATLEALQLKRDAEDKLVSIYREYVGDQKERRTETLQDAIDEAKTFLHELETMLFTPMS